MEKFLHADSVWPQPESRWTGAIAQAGVKKPAPPLERRTPPSTGSGLTDTTIGYLVRDVHRALGRTLQARIASHGVSIGQWLFLRALWDEDGLTQRELSQRVGMMEPTTVTALNSMERCALVQRVRNAQDRRKVNIYLTPKGKALREVLLPCSIEINQDALAGVNNVDLTTAMNVLRRVVENLTGQAAIDEDRPTTDGDVILLA